MAELMFEPLHPQLETRLAEQDYGRAFEQGGFVAHVADRPIALRLRSVFAALGRDVPPEVDLYRRFEVWLVPNRVNLLRRRGLAEITSLGLECEYLNDERTCCLVGLLPEARFVTCGEIAGTMECRGAFSAAGELMGSVSRLATQSQAENIEQQGLTFSVAAAGDVSVNFKLRVASPRIAAVGVGSGRAEWRFDLDQDPLFGQDIETWSVVVLPKRQRRLSLRLRMYCTWRTAFFPTRHQTCWQALSCELLND